MGIYGVKREHFSSVENKKLSEKFAPPIYNKWDSPRIIFQTFCNKRTLTMLQPYKLLDFNKDYQE